MDAQLWQQWRDDWQWVLELMRAKRHLTEPVEVLEPIAHEELGAIADIVGPLPQDFVDVVTNYSAGVRFSWSIIGQVESPQDMRNIPTWGGHHRVDSSWVFNVRRLPELATIYSDFYDELCSIFDDWPEAAEFANCVCFLQLGPRALAVFKPDGKIAAISNDDYPVPLHIADDFASFMTMWSSTGCAGPETWGIASFVRGDVSIANWRAWLESVPSRIYVDPSEDLDPCLCCGHLTVKPGPVWYSCRVCLWFRQVDSKCTMPGCEQCGTDGSLLAEARKCFERIGVSKETHRDLALTPAERATIPRVRA